MRVGLFIPCYINQFYPKVAVATLELLNKLGLDSIEYPLEQTCCGQPLANSGFCSDAEEVARKFISTFKNFDYVVCPFGYCDSMVKNQYPHLLNLNHDIKVFELSEFIYDILGIRKINGCYRKKIALHQSCHGLRELGLAKSSERVCAHFGKPEELLRAIADIDIVELKRKDEGRGFGGTLAVTEESLCVSMRNIRMA